MTRFSCIARAAILLGVATASMPAQSAQLTPAQIREDIAWFRRDVLAVEQSYTDGARAEAERRLAWLQSNADGLTPVAFEIAISRIAALADNGHSGVNAAGRSRRYNRVPLRFGQFGDEVRVLRAGVAHADLLGARLVAVDGRPIAIARDMRKSLFR